MLELKEVTFAYGATDPLRFNFSLTARAGEITGISGPSGSGKSTLFDLIAGFLMPTGGEITLDGQAITQLPPEERPVSFLFQRNNVFEHLSAARNVALGKKGQHPNDPETRDALQSVGLADYSDRRVSKLSGGQQQRVALARALLADQKLLLLDEPFAALDADTAQECRALVRELTFAHKWTTLLVSHDQADMDDLATRRYLLQDGELTAVEGAA